MTVSVSRVSFEDRGQDFLWWEIDMETGRIVGCGPFQADLWASGRCSVDLNTLVVAQRPRFFGPATDPEGRILNYRIEAIRPVAGTEGAMTWGIDLAVEAVQP